MAAELLGHRAAGSIGAVGVVSAHFRKLVPVSAPAPLELEGVQVEHHHAPTEVIIGGIKLVSGFVEPYLFESAHDHRSGGRILHAKSRNGFLPSRDRCRISLTATAA